MAKRAGILIGLAHIDDLKLAQMLFDPMGFDLPDAGEGQSQRRPGRFFDRRPALADSAFEIGRHGDIHLLGMGQAEIAHVAHEIVLAQLAAQARIEAPLLAHARDHEPAIVVAGIKQAGLGQRKDFGVHGTVHGAGIALLEIGPPAAPDQQAIAGEGHAFVIQYIGDAAIRVPWRRTHLEIAFAEDDALVIVQKTVGASGTGGGAQRDPAAQM